MHSFSGLPGAPRNVVSRAVQPQRMNERTLTGQHISAGPQGHRLEK